MGCTPSKDHKRSRTFKPIPDRFTNLAQVQQAVRHAGLESSNLILGVDFTKSNTWTGRETFRNCCLHDTTCGVANPYQQVIDVIGRTLEEFDDDRLIPAYGFGDATTGDKQCFAFNANDRPSHGVQEVLSRYEEIADAVALAGPTSFAPVIHQAIDIVREEESYHILVIIADGQVTDASPYGETARAIIEASHYPLSIVVVGVGDGPWHAMETYDDELPERHFDNFQFVDFNRVVHGCRDHQAMEAQFALAALMEVPDQYSFIKSQGLLNPANFPQRRGPSLLAPCPVPPSTVVVAAPPRTLPSALPSTPRTPPAQSKVPNDTPPPYALEPGHRVEPTVSHVPPAMTWA